MTVKQTLWGDDPLHLGTGSVCNKTILYLIWIVGNTFSFHYFYILLEAFSAFFQLNYSLRNQKWSKRHVVMSRYSLGMLALWVQRLEKEKNNACNDIIHLSWWNLNWKVSFFASSPKGSGFDLRLQKTKKNVTQEAAKERKSTKLDSTEKYASLSQAIDLLLLL